MSRGLSAAVLGTLSLALPACAATETPPPAAVSEYPVIPGSPFAPLVKRVSPAVVSIDTVSPDGEPVPWIRETPEGTVAGMSTPLRRGAGSGFFISADGYVVTNDHVNAAPTQITRSLPGGGRGGAREDGREGGRGWARG